jgi:hypothetical protein
MADDISDAASVLSAMLLTCEPVRATRILKSLPQAAAVAGGATDFFLAMAFAFLYVCDWSVVLPRRGRFVGDMQSGHCAENHRLRPYLKHGIYIPPRQSR